MAFSALVALTLHDVKNRLAAQAARAESAADLEARNALIESAETLSRLLTLFKAEQGLLGLAVDADCPADLLQELAVLRLPAGAPRIVVAADEAPPLWYYDRNLVRMVLNNALHNALRHAREEISLSARQTADGSFLILSVTDDGPGFPPAMLGLFPSPTPLSEEGTGLGLLLSQRVAEMHGTPAGPGSIRLSNQPGACFSLWLPA